MLNLLFFVFIKQSFQFNLDSLIDNRSRSYPWGSRFNIWNIHEHHLLYRAVWIVVNYRNLLLNSYLLLLLLFNLLFDDFFFLLTTHLRLLSVIVTLIIVIAWMVFLKLLWLKVKVIDVSTWRTTRFPLVWKWRFQAFFCYVEEVSILLHVHSEVLCILLDLFYRGIIFFIKLLLHYLETLSK